MRGSDMPADFIANSSKCSPRLPIAMIADKSIERGKPSGIIFAVAQTNSSAMVETSRPLPVSSSIYRHTKFIISTNCTMKKVATRGPR